MSYAAQKSPRNFHTFLTGKLRHSLSLQVKAWLPVDNSQLISMAELNQLGQFYVGTHSMFTTKFTILIDYDWYIVDISIVC